MSLTTVANSRTYKGSMTDAVYIGRPTRYGNPFKMRPGAMTSTARTQVIAQFRDWWYADEQSALRIHAIRELTGKTLLCWCHPLPCHGDVIAEFLNRAI